MERPTHDQQLDDELAALTDALLEGRDAVLPSVSDENVPLEPVVRGLYDLTRDEPSRAFEARLQRRLNDEWTARPRPVRLSVLQQPVVRLMALAAALMIIMVGILLAAGGREQNALQGTALGSMEGLALLLLLVGGVVVVFLLRRR